MTYSDRLRTLADLFDSSPLLEQIEDRVQVAADGPSFHLTGVDQWRAVAAHLVDEYGPFMRAQTHGDWLLLRRETASVGTVTLYVPRYDAPTKCDLPEVDLGGIVAALVDEAVSA